LHIIRIAPALQMLPPVCPLFKRQDAAPVGDNIPTNGSLEVGKNATLCTPTWHGGTKPQDSFLLLLRKEFSDFTPGPPV
jgi:hypothetical protein